MKKLRVKAKPSWKWSERSIKWRSCCATVAGHPASPGEQEREEIRGRCASAVEHSGQGPDVRCLNIRPDIRPPQKIWPGTRSVTQLGRHPAPSPDIWPLNMRTDIRPLAGHPMPACEQFGPSGHVFPLSPPILPRTTYTHLLPPL